jgi:hypothetical protein
MNSLRAERREVSVLYLIYLILGQVFLDLLTETRSEVPVTLNVVWD